MDPNATWQAILDILNQRSTIMQWQWIRLIHLSCDLRAWNCDDGFLPEKAIAAGLSKQGLDRTLAMIATYAERANVKCRYCGYLVDADGLCTRNGCAGQT